MDSLRPVIVKREKVDAYESYNLDDEFAGLFHTWAGTSELAYALIETAHGDVIRVKRDGFRFVDNIMATNQFQYAFRRC